jgi:sugar phosphate isomerase/epimerase
MSKPYPIALQLYSLRETAADDLAGVLKRVAHAGFRGVEFAGFYGHGAEEVRKIMDDLGMTTCSVHGAFPSEETVAGIVETAQALGFTRHVAGFGADRFATRDHVLAAAEQAQKAAELLKPHGLTFGYHNHWWEFEGGIDGMSPHALFMQNAPDVFAEIDTYWVKVGGADPAAVVSGYGSRAPLLHIKDGPGDRQQAMTAVGDGIMDWPRVIGAASDATEWLIVELDRCDTDMQEAVAASCVYLKAAGLGR